jgi:hypothetical protein
MDCREDEANGGTRISPLRGGISQDEIVSQTRIVQNGLGALRDCHYNVLSQIRDEYENKCNANGDNDDAEQEPDKDDEVRLNGKKNSVDARSDSLLEERINTVTSSLEKLEVGIEESSVIISLSAHFQRLEADRATLRLEMGRVNDENDWLREELGDTQKSLQDAVAELETLREEKRKWEFEEELKMAGAEASVRPITPSKIPVGSWRVEEEKEINRALNGDMHSSTSSSSAKSRAVSPAPSRIPLGGWRSKLSVYKKVMDKKEEQDQQSNTRKNSKMSKQYFNLNSHSSRNLSRSRSKIPASR